MIKKQTAVILVVAALVAGYWLAGQPRSPLGGGKPRPVLAAIVRAAKNLLWISLAFEPPPAVAQSRLVETPAVGEDGFPVIDHGRGW